MHHVLARAGHYLVYLAVRVFVCVLQALSLETCERLARVAAGLCADTFRLRRRVVEENLRIAFPDLSPGAQQRLIRDMWEHLFLLVVEVAHAPRKIHETNWRQFMSMRDHDKVCSLMFDERPTIFVSAHLGNFELAGYVTGLLGVPTFTVARTLDNPYLNDWVNRFRGAKGARIVPKKGGFEQIDDVMNCGGSMVLLADQYAGSKGCWVDFFGQQASTHKAIALLALDSQARILVFCTRRRGRALYHEMGVEAVYDPREGSLDDVKSLTQWYTYHLEQAIRATPSQYWWVHRRWKDNRPARKKARLVA